MQGAFAVALILTSSAFSHQTDIPSKYTCEGADVSPALSWSNLPKDTKSLALIVDDPDAPDPKAPKMTFVHWLLYNIPIDMNGLPEGVDAKILQSKGILQGKNDWHRVGYGGPCPPVGVHRYFFKLYALDTILSDLKEPSKPQLEQALEGHVLEKVELLGNYQLKERKP